MQRRSFVKASLFSGSFKSLAPLVAGSSLAADEPAAAKQEWYELRTYTLRTAMQQKLVGDYWAAAIPALNRLGCKKVGVFTEQKSGDNPKIYALIPYNSPDHFATVNSKLSSDAAYAAAASAYLNAPASEPAYDRIENSLLQAFAHMPRLEVPAKKAGLFELRRYESASENAGKKKIDMFNNLGEIDIFRRVGLRPVFFGETFVGGARPNLTYLLAYEDMADHDRNWKAFSQDPEWKKISAEPDYADAKIVSKITSTFLVPAAVSQI